MVGFRIGKPVLPLVSNRQKLDKYCFILNNFKFPLVVKDEEADLWKKNKFQLLPDKTIHFFPVNRNCLV